MERRLFRGAAKDIKAAQNDPQEIIRLVPGLNFKPLTVDSGYWDGMMWRSDGHRRIINDTTYEAIDGGNTVSRHYRPHDVKAILQSLCEISKMAGMVLSEAVVLGGGEHIILRAESEFSFAPALGDVHTGSVLFKISNVPGVVSKCSAFVLRLVCLNGATARENLGDILSLHHRRDYDSAARETVEKMTTSLNTSLVAHEGRLQKLYKPSRIYSDIPGYFREVLDIPKDSEETRTVQTLQELVWTQPGASETFYGGELPTLASLYNAVTYWVDHKRGRKPEAALYSSIYGDGARLKLKALHKALEIIGEE